MEQQFLYGHHVLKSGLGRITENTPKYQGVVVLSMADVPLVSSCVKWSLCDMTSFWNIIYQATVLLWNALSCSLKQGFGKAAKSTSECKHADPLTIVCFHQADIGEYVRSEETLLWVINDNLSIYDLICIIIGK